MIAWLAFVVAVYSAILSTWNAVRDYREKRPEVHVRLQLSNVRSKKNPNGVQIVQIIATNRRTLPIAVEAVDIVFPGGISMRCNLDDGFSNFPIQLVVATPLTWYKRYIDVVDYAQQLNLHGEVEIYGEVKEATGLKFRSKVETLKI